MFSKTAQREEANVRTIYNLQKKEGVYKPCQFSISLFSNKKYKWHGFLVTEFKEDIVNYPDASELQKVLDNFNNPPEKELADKEEEGR